MAADWYDQGLDRATLKATVHAALLELNWSNPVLVHRDYHAQNLIWLPHRHDAQRVGILDFQDAALGHPVYDVASLLNDARRDVSAQVARSPLTDRLRTTTPDFDHAFAVLSAQRNLRILGGVCAVVEAGWEAAVC